MRSLTLLVLLFQLNSTTAQFVLNGDATRESVNSYVLTSDQPQQNGSIWSQERIDISQSFEFNFEIFLGDKDFNGADGMYFALQSRGNNIGLQGEYLGFGNVSPAIGFEFDTWQNVNRADPPFDHLALMKDGSIDHDGTRNLSGPISISSTALNVEDGEWHTVKIVWDAGNELLSLYFDCSLRISHAINLTNEVSNGNTRVFYGFTASSGGASNRQAIRIIQPVEKTTPVDTSICAGDRIQLSTLSGLENYQWTPKEYIEDENTALATVFPLQTTTYKVTSRDKCGNSFETSYRVTVDSENCPQTIENKTLFILGLPSAFSPNGDNLNDRLLIRMNPDYDLKMVRIMNRQGFVVFETTQKDQFWDGTYNGLPVNSGIYHVQIIFKDDKGNEYTQNGFVELLR